MNNNYIKLVDIDKQQLLEKSDVFCMYPWTHLNATPIGNIFPCCSNDYTDPIGNTKDLTLGEAINSDYMKQLRLNMMSGKKSKICNFCYDHEKASPYSFRTYSIEHFSQHFDECLSNTRTDGTLDNFKMRYFDIRFSNICNFKCRTCGSEFSSQWAIEDKKVWNSDGPIVIHVDDEKGNILQEIMDHMDYIDLAYFAGGEPLITPEHYVILEELIRRGKTDTVLRYNTNASTLKYKDYDLLDLWKRFKRVEVSCSIDHYGEKAEMLRHGTDWGKVENNLKKLRNLESVEFQYNTVFSIFNYLTITDFYQYMSNAGLLDLKNDWHHSLYLAPNPTYYCAKAMPRVLKNQANENILKYFSQGEFGCLKNHALNAVNFADENDTWENEKAGFFHMKEYLDQARNEDLFSVFPELKPLEDL